MEFDPKTGMQASRPPLLMRQADPDVGSTKCGYRTPPCLGQGFLIMALHGTVGRTVG